MPTIPVYLNETTYWRLSREASRYEMSLGKFMSRIADNYAQYLEKGGRTDGAEEIQARR